VLVEDEPLLAKLMAQMLAERGFDVRIAGEVVAARQEIDRFDPDLLLLDVFLGDGPTGIHLAHAVHLSHPGVAMLIFTRHEDLSRVTRDGNLPPGIAVLSKHLVADADYLVDAMEKTFAEKKHIAGAAKPTTDAFGFLGANGSRVLRLIAEGYSNAEIAIRCDASKKSVERWIDQLYRDLRIETKGPLNPRVEAARRYFSTVGIPNSPS
jgi:DNA-binding NarL/FixJ family response regulator